ncbi:MAG: hypothetical protein H0X66_11280 [Verrucomicrobia bacterium]|nr:hypothetical protein [Verrucomicrobiota bacterium]
MLSTDLFVAMGLLAIALIPISFSFLNEQKLCRAYYQRALATQILDGEMEVLAAGEWRAFKEGEQDYPVSTAATKNLPAGKFFFSRTGKNLRMEWQPVKNDGRGKLIREAVGQ